MEASWRSRPPVLQPLARAGEDWMEPRWEGEQWPPQGLAGRQTLVGEGGRSQEEHLGLALTSCGRKLWDLPVPTGTPGPSGSLWDPNFPEGQGLQNMNKFNLFLIGRLFTYLITIIKLSTFCYHLIPLPSQLFLRQNMSDFPTFLRYDGFEYLCQPDCSS